MTSDWTYHLPPHSRDFASFAVSIHFPHYNALGDLKWGHWIQKNIDCTSPSFEALKLLPRISWTLLREFGWWYTGANENVLISSSQVTQYKNLAGGLLHIGSYNCMDQPECLQSILSIYVQHSWFVLKTPCSDVWLGRMVGETELIEFSAHANLTFQVEFTKFGNKVNSM